MSEHLENRLAFAKEQLEIGNYGRVDKIADELIDSEEPIFLKEGLILRGLSHFSNGEFEDANDYFSETIKQFSDFEKAYLYRYETYIRLNNFEEAQLDALKLIEFDAVNPTYQDFLIKAELYLKNYESVVDICTKNLEATPNDFEFLSARASANFRLEKFEDAIADYQAVLEIEGVDEMNVSPVNNAIGYSFSRLGKYEEAEDFLRLAIEEDQYSAPAINNLGWVLINLEEEEKGLGLINAAIKIDPNNSYAYKNRAKYYLKKEDNERAKEDLLLAKELGYEERYGEEVDELLGTIEN